MKSYIVYKHTTPSNKIYIGITGTSTNQRWNNGKGYAKHPYFYNAIKKYGWDNITHEILFDNLTKEDACIKEKELIKFYNSNNPKYGYNMTSGGEMCTWNELARNNLSKSKLGHITSEQTKLKISNSEKGKIVSEESKQKMSVSQRNKVTSQGTIDNLRLMAQNRIGTHRDELTKLKISNSLKGHPSTTPKGKNHPNYGKHLSDDTRRKISQSHKNNITDKTRQIVSESISKKVHCIETDEIFPSISSAAKHYKISASQLGAVCNKTGNYKTAGKLHWEFV